MDEALRRDLEAGRHVKVTALARAANVSPNTLYGAIARGEVRAVKIRESIRIHPCG